MASSLLDYPTDVLSSIMVLLSRADLYTTCLVHSDLRTFTEPFLYSKIQWVWLQSQVPPIVLLLRSILHRPQLAAFIQTVILEGDTFWFPHYLPGRDYPKLPVTDTRLDRATEYIEKLDVAYGTMWIQELRRGTMDAFVALLLSQLPNLRYLHLGKNFTQESRIIWMVFRSALYDMPEDHRIPTFQYIQDVSAVYFDPGTSIRKYTDVRNTADVLPLFYLPSVKRISVSIENPITFTWPTTYLPNPSRLVSLDLTMIREGHLGQVLSVARGLKTLRWDWSYRWDLRDHFVTDTIDLDQIITDLSHVRDTLTDLTITAGSDIVNADPQYPTLQVTGSFEAIADFTELKRLEVPLPLLTGFSPIKSRRLNTNLPRNIEYLTITDDLCLQQEYEWEDVDLLEAIRSWLGDWKASTPRLQGFHLLLKIMNYEDWGPAIRQELRNLCTEAGIQVGITKLAGDM